jgi:hypothetical protein
MKPQELHEIGQTLSELAKPGMSPKQLFEAVKARHQKAKRRDIARAALAMMIETADARPALAVQLQDFAFSQRDVVVDD